MVTENTNGEAATPENNSSENTAVEIMSGTGPVTAADIEAQLLAQEEKNETTQEGSDDDSDATGSEDESQNAEQNAENEAGEETETKEETNTNADEQEEETDDKEKLSPELQAVVDKRIGKEVAKRKGLEEDLEKERASTTTLQDELETLTTQLEESPVSTPSNIHPLLMVENEEDIAAWEEKYWDFRRWSKQYKDGYEGEDEQGNDVSYTSEEIAARLDDLTEQKERFLPQAREALTKRAEFEGKVKAVYPNLFEKKTSEYREMLSIAKAVPALKQLPDYKMVIGDIIEGRKARLNKAEEETAENNADENSAEKKKEKVKVKIKKQPPKVPVHNAPGKASSVSSSAGDTATKGINTRRFVEMGGGMDALEELLYQNE